MKFYISPDCVRKPRLMLCAPLALFLVACGSSSADDPELQAALQASVSGNIDVNNDGRIDVEDDINFDGVIDQTDVNLYASGDLPDRPGNIDSNCLEKDCVSDNELWSDNALVSTNRNPISPYALAIQRITYCQNFGGDAGLDAFADGIFGEATAAAVVAYQSDRGLVANGIIGPETWDAMQSDLEGPNNFDTEYQSYVIPSVRPDCENQIMFYQQIAEPKGWEIAATPGGTIRSLMTIFPANLP